MDVVPYVLLSSLLEFRAPTSALIETFSTFVGSGNSMFYSRKSMPRTTGLLLFILGLGVGVALTAITPSSVQPIETKLETASGRSGPSRLQRTGTIVISVESEDEFSRILLPTLHNIKFETDVTLLYDHRSPDGLEAILENRTDLSNLSFRFLDVTAYWSPTERELELSANSETECAGFSNSYRSMCAFWILHVHDVLSAYRWYWRLDTDSRLLAPVTSDVFQWAEATGQQFFGVDYRRSPTCSDGLVDAIGSWLLERPKYETYAWLPSVFNTVGDISSWTGHLVSTHFELIDMDLMRTEAWHSYASMINASGGIWTARWGDHQIKTLFAGLFWPSMRPQDRCLITSYSHQDFGYDSSALYDQEPTG